LKLKIVQLIQKPQLRGAEIFASQLSTHLSNDGHEVVVISLVPGDAILPFNGRIIKLDRPLSKRLIDVGGWRQLAKHIREIDADVVQANAGDTLKFAVFSKVMFGWKAAIVFRNANKVSDFLNSRLKRIFNRFLVGRTTHVISVSELCRQDFIRTYSFDAAKTTTVPVGIELSPVKGVVPEDLKPIFNNSIILVNVASFVPEKNHVGLLRIMKRLLEYRTDLRLLFIGDGKLKASIQEEVARMNLTDHIFFAGYRKDVLSIVKSARLLLLPSIIEGLPAVILEAMYCGTPVISYDVGGIAEIIKPGETGWLVKSGNEEAFVETIRSVLGSNEIEPLQRKAHEMVVNEFNNSSIAKRFADVYKSVVKDNVR
jgi:glycosyltransferase involved in cell wall biosynthesis